MQVTLYYKIGLIINVKNLRVLDLNKNLIYLLLKLCMLSFFIVKNNFS